MCGRCASSRDAQGVRHACAYRPQGQGGRGRGGGGGRKAVLPTWLQCSPQQQYYPSYNINPQANTPVLLSGHHPHVLEYQKSLKTADSTSHASEAVEQRVLQTMKWGLIPSWHRGSPSSFGMVLNNCRHETMLEKPSFRNAVQKGRRCVVVADGFFEWYRGKGQRQPYFIYFADNAPTEEMLQVSAAPTEEMLQVSAASETVEGDGEEEGEEKREEGKEGQEKTKAAEAVGSKNVWEHPSGRMLTMAGLFDIWSPEPAGDPLFTYTVITVEAQPTFSQIHHRMPAVLDGQEAVWTWLDPSCSMREVYGLLQPVDCLHWHQVSAVVNNSRNNTPECVMPIDVSKQASSQKSTLLNWFSKSPRQSGASSDTPPLVKRPRLHPSQ